MHRKYTFVFLFCYAPENVDATIFNNVRRTVTYHLKEGFFFITTQINEKNTK